MTHVIRSSFFVAIRLYKSVPLAANITSYDTRMGPGSVQVPITEPFLEPVLRSGDIPRLDPVDPRLAPFGPLLSRAPWDNLPPPLLYRLFFDRQRPEDTGKVKKTCVDTVGVLWCENPTILWYPRFSVHSSPACHESGARHPKPELSYRKLPRRVRIAVSKLTTNRENKLTRSFDSSPDAEQDWKQR